MNTLALVIMEMALKCGKRKDRKDNEKNGI